MIVIRMQTQTRDRSRHRAKVGPRDQHIHTPHRTYCLEPPHRQRAAHGEQLGCVDGQHPRVRHVPRSAETPDDPPDTCSRSAEFQHKCPSCQFSSTGLHAYMSSADPGRKEGLRFFSQ